MSGWARISFILNHYFAFQIIILQTKIFFLIFSLDIDTHTHTALSVETAADGGMLLSALTRAPAV